MALIIESWHYRRVNAKAQWLACATAVCTRARTGGKGTRAATFCASALGNIMFIGIEALTMLMPMCCCQRAKQYCSMNRTCCTGSTRVTTLTCIQVLLSCTGGRRSGALVFLCSSIIPWSPAVILRGMLSLLPSMPRAHWWQCATWAGSAWAGKGFGSHTLPQTRLLQWPNAFLQGFCQH